MNSLTLNQNAVIPFDPRMAYDIALGLEDPVTVAAEYGLTSDQYYTLKEYHPFQQAVERYMAELKEKGVTFRIKAALQAEALLPEVFRMSLDPNTPASVRADLIKWQAKVGNLEPKEKQSEAVSGLHININLG